MDLFGSLVGTVASSDTNVRQEQHKLSAQFFKAIAIAGWALALFRPELEPSSRLYALLLGAMAHTLALIILRFSPIVTDPQEGKNIA